ncbi:hypothetical protein RCZ04_03340 [Capnocytophaga sp. HP1101]
MGYFSATNVYSFFELCKKNEKISCEVVARKAGASRTGYKGEFGRVGRVGHFRLVGETTENSEGLRREIRKKKDIGGIQKRGGGDFGEKGL